MSSLNPRQVLCSTALCKVGGRHCISSWEPNPCILLGHVWRLRHWPGKGQAFTSLMASMRQALFVTVVIRKMNMYPEETKAPAYVTQSRPQATTLAMPHAAPPVPQPWLDQSSSLQTWTHQHHAQGTMPLATPGGTGRPALQLPQHLSLIHI